MAKKNERVDVLVVPYYSDAKGARKSGGRLIMPGGVRVVSATAGSGYIQGLAVGAIHVDERCWGDRLRIEWANEVIEELLAGAEK